MRPIPPQQGYIPISIITPTIIMRVVPPIPTTANSSAGRSERDSGGVGVVVRVHEVCCCCMAVGVCQGAWRGLCEWVVEDVAVGLGVVVRVGVIAVVVVSTLGFVGLDDDDDDDERWTG
ncbi:hypothetical protein PILCRDRAFT_426678 [Piloderma croceum F 1598]|uniref:Uncharacterized protein n=1 Tax=Piloderma croceum (strain F 1598) TaxID=765440 RepID=A0A0C3FVK7_PILCF|nr:hypothetical protein PILCRDRAFT_426678 [Piloderma croceum F 1598]